MVMFPQYFLNFYILQLGLFYPVTATTVVCCILMQILCAVSQKTGPRWGLPSPRSPVFFNAPPIIL